MKNKYYIVYEPITYDLMDYKGECETPLDLLGLLSGKTPSVIDEQNYLEYLNFDERKKKEGMAESMALESYVSVYLANQIAKFESDTPIILADGNRRTINEIIEKKGKPAAIFITSISSNFPTTVCSTIVLNHVNVPIIIGGIHVSCCPGDVDLFIKKHIQHPEFVSIVRGAGDSEVIRMILDDLSKSNLKPEYTDQQMIENGAWGHKNIDEMESLKWHFLEKIPIIGKSLKNKFRFNPIAPFMGCPYSCKFCSIYSIPKSQRKFSMRSPEDFADEIEYLQRNGTNFKNRLFLFSCDNLLMGGNKINEYLDEIIKRKLLINYATQISIDVADDELLLKKLRLSGLTHMFIGFESLDIRNLRLVEKSVVKAIDKSGKTAKQYYADQIKKIQNQGISVHGSFILGMPYDYFNSLDDNTAVEISDFCIKNHIGAEPNAITDLPGSQYFIESQEKGTYMYAKQGTIDYLVTLCESTLNEGNRIPPESLKKSPLIVMYMVYETVNRVGKVSNASKSGLFMMPKAFQHPTVNGRFSLKQRCLDSFIAFVAQLVPSMFKEHGDKVVTSIPGKKGTYERFFEMETNKDVKKEFGQYIKNFVHDN